MSDLISKEKAIEQMSLYGSVWMEYTDDMTIEQVAEEALRSSKQALIEVVKQLPSATDKNISTMSELISRQVLDMWDRYKPTIAVDAIEYDRELKQLLGMNLAEVGTDCISRQAAIEAVMECYDNDELFEVYEWKLNELPTIQPEITHEQAIDYLHSTGWMQEHDRQMMLDGVHRLTAQPEPHWIPVTERLPAMGKSVLMCDIDGDIYLGHRTQCGYYYPDFCGDRVKNVTAWCNLPEPYKGVTG